MKRGANKKFSKIFVDTIVMPQFLVEEMQDCIRMIYGIETDQRIFTISKSALHREMERGSKEADVKRIRIHDLRHSAISLLIDMGFSATAIADRVGHESMLSTKNLLKAAVICWKKWSG